MTRPGGIRVLNGVPGARSRPHLEVNLWQGHPHIANAREPFLGTLGEPNEGNYCEAKLVSSHQFRIPDSGGRWKKVEEC